MSPRKVLMPWMYSMGLFNMADEKLIAKCLHKYTKTPSRP